MKKHPPSSGQIFQLVHTSGCRFTLAVFLVLRMMFLDDVFVACDAEAHKRPLFYNLIPLEHHQQSVCVFLTHLCKSWTSLWYQNQCGCELWLFSNRQKCGRFYENGDESCDQPTASEPGLGRSRSTIWHSERIQRQSSWRGGESS